MNSNVNRCRLIDGMDATGHDSLLLFPSETERKISQSDNFERVAVRGPGTLPPRQSDSMSPARRRMRTSLVTAALVLFGSIAFVLSLPEHSVTESSVPESNVPEDSVPSVPHAAIAAAPSVPAPTAPPVEVAHTAAPRPEAIPEQRIAVPVAAAEDRLAPSAASVATARTFTGVLIIESVPPGATVLMNLKPVGVTPLHLTAHPAGSYAIRLEREGFERWTAGIRVTADTTTHINPVLKNLQ
jgi:hypothetical protein